MLTVYKYDLRPGYTDLRLPQGAKILHVGAQGDEPRLWALVDTAQAATWDFRFLVTGTGQPITVDSPADLRHVGTVTLSIYGMPTVWHVFEVPPSEEVGA